MYIGLDMQEAINDLERTFLPTGATKNTKLKH